MSERSEQRLGVRHHLLTLGFESGQMSKTPRWGAEPEMIWQYWDSGFDSAPPVVRAAAASVDQYAWAPITRLTDESIVDFVSIPQVIWDKRSLMSKTHFSDVLRLHLLAEHGGTWIDATVMLSGRRPVAIERLPFFAFTRPEDPMLLAVWYLQAKPGHPLVLAWRDLLVRYWETHDEVVDYFVLHHLFEVLVTTQSRARRYWRHHTPVWSYEGPHDLQAMLNEPLDPANLAELLGREWIHKLTYKLEGRRQNRLGNAPTVLEHLLDQRNL